jgi:hypothetical protein
MSLTERDAAILAGLDKVLHALTGLGDAVGEVIQAINVPDVEITDPPPTGGYEDLRHRQCGTCGKPSYPHPYRHPITPLLIGSRRGYGSHP